MRKRIGVLLAQVEENTQAHFMQGFMKEAYAHDYDICVFSMYQKYQETELRDIGDSNIYRLVPYEMFDAILIMLDTILTPGLADPLQRRVKEHFQGPVLVVDQESAFFPSVMIDHYTPMYKLIDHLIVGHGYEDIAFLGGKEGHPHSVARLKAFTDCMQAHNLPVNGNRIYHGNYWYDSAKKYVDILLQERDKLPRAIACANDIMAIGAATRLVEKGVRVPEEVAVIGYDSMEDGRNSPVPLTSAEIPAGECGEYCFKKLYASINGLEEPVFETKAPLYIGGSCGCDYKIEMVPKKLRHQWRTAQSSNSFYSDFNHLLEDLLSQMDYKNFYKTVFEYIYQIRPFHSFYLCVNDNFMYPEQNIGNRAIKSGFSMRMHQIISCGPDEETGNKMDFMDFFPTETLLPALYEERDYPTTFIFNPLYFDDRCFGYSAISYGRELKVYDETYRVWMRHVMQGLEAFYRQQTLQKMIEQIQSSQTRDSLTGLYNYRGFLNLATILSVDCEMSNQPICILALDVKGIKVINEELGREAGNRVLRVVARFLQSILKEEEICSRLSNDEFLIALPGEENSERQNVLLAQLHEQLATYRLEEDLNFVIDFNYGCLSGQPTDAAALESLINHTVGLKNHNKAMLRAKVREEAELTLDDIQRNQIVEQVLNKNLLSYRFQPIINAHDGSIFAYEALMRCDEYDNIGPAEIMQSAAYLNRLYDIERATMFNVMNYYEANIGKFAEAKVFVNSLPAHQLKGEDALWMAEKLNKYNQRMVIEITEESELDDETLDKIHENSANGGVEIALDDYGAGYSNVNNLLRYMPRYVKIDRMLIKDIQKSPQKQHFVRSIVEFSHQNNIMALAEGVENAEELKESIRLNVDLIQGYYVAKPRKDPQKEIEEEIVEEVLRYQSKNTWDTILTS